MKPMLLSPATERRTSKNVALGPQLLSCEAQRDLVFARAPTSKTALKPAQPTGAAHRTGILKPLRVIRAGAIGAMCVTALEDRARPLHKIERGSPSGAS